MPSSDNFHTLIMGGGPLATGLEIYLDGMPLKGVTRIEIVADLHEIVRVNLELIAHIGPSKLSVLPELALPLNIEELPPHIQQIAEDLMTLMNRPPKEDT